MATMPSADVAALIVAASSLMTKGIDWTINRFRGESSEHVKLREQLISMLDKERSERRVDSTDLLARIDRLEGEKRTFEEERRTWETTRVGMVEKEITLLKQIAALQMTILEKDGQIAKLHEESKAKEFRISTLEREVKELKARAGQ